MTQTDTSPTITSVPPASSSRAPSDTGSSGAAPAGAANGRRGRWWALAALAVSGLTIGLDATVLNIALPKLSASLHAGTSQLQWFSDAYTLVVAVAMLPVANLADRYGRKRFLVAFLVLFAAASGWCAAASSSGELIAARAVLGIAGAGLLPLGFAMLPVLFPDEAGRVKATAIWTAASAIGLPLGPILGGLLLDHFWWGSVFLINVPLAAFGAVMLVLLLPESRSEKPLSLDLPGTVFSSVGLGAVIYGLISAGEHGWGAAQTLAPMLAGLVPLATFVLWDRHSDHPLVELSLFRDARFSWGTVHATIANFAFFGLLFAVPQYFQSVDGTSPLGAGLRLLPMIAGLVVGSQLSSQMMRRTGAGLLIAAGFALIAVSLAAAVSTTVTTGYGFTAAWITVLGLGAGLALPTAMTSALAALSAERSGAGSGVMQAVRQVGGTIGVAVLGTVLENGYQSHIHAHVAPALAHTVSTSVGVGVEVARKLGDESLVHAVRTAFVHGMDLTFVVAAAVVAVGAILAVCFLPLRSGHAERPAANSAR